jgi:hypothetical protein
LRYIGQHMDSLSLLHGIITALWFFEADDNGTVDENEEFDIEEISLSVQYQIQFLLVALDMDDPDYEWILIEL